MRPAIILTAEETDRLLGYLAEAPAKFSFDPIALLLAKRAAAEAPPEAPPPQE